MAEPILDAEKTNYETFRDCLSEPVLRTLAAPIGKAKKKKKSRRGKLTAGKVEKVTMQPDGTDENDNTAAEDLGEFIDARVLLISSSLFTY